MSAVLRYSVAALAVLLVAGCSTMGNNGRSVHSTHDQAQLASQAATVLQHQKSQPADKQIPQAMIRDAKCIAVFPSIIKAGFIIGGDRGKGLVSCRQKSSGWSQAAPVVYTITGGSVGLQAGAQSSSVILLFETRNSVQALLHDQFKLGVQAGVTAGPVGLHTHLANAPAPILAYVTSRKGLFAGVNLNGNQISFDDDANAALYGANADQSALLLSSHSVQPSMKRYSRALQGFVSELSSE